MAVQSRMSLLNRIYIHISHSFSRLKNWLARNRFIALGASSGIIFQDSKVLTDGHPITKPFTVAIVGGGIGGLALAIGLRHHGIAVQIYEASPSFSEIGAGIAFGPNAVKAMALLDPAIRDVFSRLATKNGFAEEEDTWINFRNGFGEPESIAKVQTGDREKTGLSSVHRAHFLNGLAALIPKDIAHFGKRLQKFESTESGATTLTFEDGTTAQADALVGADGVRSRVRQSLLGKESVLDGLQFTNKYAYRGLIPMAEARKAVGDDLAMNSQMYIGKDGHVLTYPIDHGKTMNVVAFQNKEEGIWEHDNWVVKKMGDEMRSDFSNWGTSVLAVLDVRQIKKTPQIPPPRPFRRLSFS